MWFFFPVTFIPLFSWLDKNMMSRAAADLVQPYDVTSPRMKASVMGKAAQKYAKSPGVW